MLVTENDNREIVLVHEIIRRVDGMDEISANRESELIYTKQPFLISLILGYRVDLKTENFELVTKCIFVIWEYFKSRDEVLRTKIIEEQFDRIHKRNFHLVRYFESETNEGKIELLKFDLGKLNAKALYVGVMNILRIPNSLRKGESETIGILLVGMKCLIECFEELTQNAYTP